MSTKKVIELANKLEKKLAQQKTNLSEQEKAKSLLQQFDKFLEILQSFPGGFLPLTREGIQRHLLILNTQTLAPQALTDLLIQLKLNINWYKELVSTYLPKQLPK